jgi:hypothetical protein
MKTLNDSLRDEFNAILTEHDISKKIDFNDLDIDVLNKAFDVLLRYKSNPDMTERARSEFENYLINYLKTKGNKL